MSVFSSSSSSSFFVGIRTGISVKTDLHTGKAVSRLYIANANRHDSGNYTCAIGDFAKVTVAVHVLNGKLNNIFLFRKIRFFSLSTFFLFLLDKIFCLFTSMESLRVWSWNEIVSGEHVVSSDCDMDAIFIFCSEIQYFSRCKLKNKHFAIDHVLFPEAHGHQNTKARSGNEIHFRKFVIGFH